MHTTPPTVMASAPNAGAVQPLTRKIAAVAISVAMVMPETGEADDPTMPTMRAETVTKRNPNTTIISEAARFVVLEVFQREVHAEPLPGALRQLLAIVMNPAGGIAGLKAGDHGHHGEFDFLFLI